MAECIVSDDGEYVELHRSVLRRARKEHPCGECGEPIGVGVLHECVTGIVEGSWISHRTCARCVNVRTDYFETWTYGMMVEDFEWTHGFDYRKGIPADFAPCRDPRGAER